MITLISGRPLTPTAPKRVDQIAAPGITSITKYVYFRIPIYKNQKIFKTENTLKLLVLIKSVSTRSETLFPRHYLSLLLYRVPGFQNTRLPGLCHAVRLPSTVPFVDEDEQENSSLGAEDDSEHVVPKCSVRRVEGAKLEDPGKAQRDLHDHDGDYLRDNVGIVVVALNR